jgi:ABC-type uncharacterized transport system permease subunit
MTRQAVETVLTSGATLTVPILWAALGEAINEQAGVINVGIEGVMLFGAFGAAFGAQRTHNLVLALLVGMATGLVSGAVLAYLYVNRGADQIVTGILFNTLAIGMTTALYEKYLSSVVASISFRPLRIPLLASIPIVGPTLFTQPIMTYLVGAFAFVVLYLMRRTWVGLHLRAVGERPEVGDSVGLSVTRLRWFAVVSGCVLTAVGGATLVLAQTGGFIPQVTGGQGFIALAVVILARWNPAGAILAAALFGFAAALQFQLQTAASLQTVPHDVWLSVPYVLTLVVVAAMRGSRYPRGVGVPYRRS